jgi:xanthine dehydrogenase/oxidase
MKTQKAVAEALGIPSAKVVVKVKRIGGAFGGKEVLSVHLAATAAVAARRLRRSVRVLLTRQEDMQRSGQRHPFLFKYKAAFAACGKLLALDATLYNNGGHTDSVTKEVMDRAIFHAANAYTVPHYRVRGRCCKTNLPDFTAFRGFGATQVMFMSETIIEEGARMCGLSAAVVRGANLVPSGYRTPYGQLVPESHLPRLWAALMLKADHDSRREALTAFNRTSKWVKRGMTVIPTMYGINFPVSMLNAVGALVMVCVFSPSASHPLIRAGGRVALLLRWCPHIWAYTVALPRTSSVLRLPVAAIEKNCTFGRATHLW